MNAAKQATWLFVALISLACCGWYFASSASLEKLDEKTLSKTPDIIISHLTLSQFDANGKLANFVKTPLLKHIPDGNTHWLETPRISIHQADGPPWQINAAEATSLHGGQEITFSRHVVIHQNADKKHPESTLNTEELVYFPKKKLAISKQEVTFKQPGNIVKSQGMKAELDKKRVKLSKARGSYDPKHG